MLDLSQISYASATYLHNGVGFTRSNETLALAIKTAGPEETYEVFDNGDFVMCI